MRTHLLRTALLAAGAVMLAIGTASAQDRYDSDYNNPNYGYDRGYDNDYANPAGYVSSDEDVHIAVPRYNYGMGKLGAPNMRVFLSREVRYDDLDLRTRHGARILRDRVKLTARILCRDLDQRYPVTADDGGDQITCYHNASENALYRVHRAVVEARYND